MKTLIVIFTLFFSTMTFAQKESGTAKAQLTFTGSVASPNQMLRDSTFFNSKTGKFDKITLENILENKELILEYKDNFACSIVNGNKILFRIYDEYKTKYKLKDCL